MNSRGNNLNAASFGFVYFNTNNKNVNNADFMAFNDPGTYSPPQGNRFSPVHYSSPTKFQKSPRNYGRQSGGRNSFRYHNSPDNKSFNSPNFNNSRNKNKSHYGRDNSSFNNSGQGNISRYYDPSCLRDPWAELEQNSSKTQVVEAKVDSPKTEVTDVEESSSNSDDEQGSELESKTSSSELEEGMT